MRLLDTRTGDFLWVSDPSVIQFAILSHVWSTQGEQSYQDLLRIQDDVRTERTLNPELPLDTILQRASAKIRDACAYALANGFDFLWLDSCCIDKTSSAELSEAINSMYAWYSLSTVCYAFLHDVDPDEDPCLPDSMFRKSVWHVRGWTLQELIAPRVVVFVSTTWSFLGSKAEMARVIEEVTGVNQGVLNHTIPLAAITVARRMSWAARRVTTRKEDEAYALMGIFGVNMPAIYGEGPLAFGRLQEEILKQVPDQTIFVWDTDHSSLDGDEYDDSRNSLLAASPAAFAYSAEVRAIPREELLRRLHTTNPPVWYMPTSRGLRTTFPLIPVGPSYCLAILACVDEHGRILALVLKKSPRGDVHAVGTVGWNAVRARYRSMLSSSTWGPQSVQGQEQYTRIVRLLQYPSLGIALAEVVVAYRPSLPPGGSGTPTSTMWSDPGTVNFVHRDTFDMESGRPPARQRVRFHWIIQDFVTALVYFCYQFVFVMALGGAPLYLLEGYRYETLAPRSPTFGTAAIPVATVLVILHPTARNIAHGV